MLAANVFATFGLAACQKLDTIAAGRFDDLIRGSFFSFRCSRFSRLSRLACHHLGFSAAARNSAESVWDGAYVMGMKLYVGNLSYDINNSSLEDMFAPYGSVRSAQVIQDRDTGRSKGFGFVEMNDDNSAREAMQALNDTEQNGRRLTVNEAKPRESRGGGYGGGGGGGYGGGGGGGQRGGYRR